MPRAPGRISPRADGYASSRTDRGSSLKVEEHGPPKGCWLRRWLRLRIPRSDLAHSSIARGSVDSLHFGFGRPSSDQHPDHGRHQQTGGGDWRDQQVNRDARPNIELAIGGYLRRSGKKIEAA